jgi:8-oxo-dGTP diphosphatase
MIVVVATVIAKKDGKFLFVEEIKPEAAGMYGLPGGQLEAGELLEECARREFIEETGYSVDTLALTSVVHKPLTQHNNTVVRFFYTGTVNDKPQGKAELKTRWLDLDEIRDLAEQGMIRGKDVYSVLSEPDASGVLTVRTF